MWLFTTGIRTERTCSYLIFIKGQSFPNSFDGPWAMRKDHSKRSLVGTRLVVVIVVPDIGHNSPALFSEECRIVDVLCILPDLMNEEQYLLTSG